MNTQWAFRMYFNNWKFSSDRPFFCVHFTYVFSLIIPTFQSLLSQIWFRSTRAHEYDQKIPVIPVLKRQVPSKRFWAIFIRCKLTLPWHQNWRIFRSWWRQCWLTCILGDVALSATWSSAVDRGQLWLASFCFASRFSTSLQWLWGKTST